MSAREGTVAEIYPGELETEVEAVHQSPFMDVTVLRFSYETGGNSDVEKRIAEDFRSYYSENHLFSAGLRAGDTLYIPGEPEEVEKLAEEYREERLA